MTAREMTLYKSAKKKADDNPLTRKKLLAEYREKRLAKKEIAELMKKWGVK